MKNSKYFSLFIFSLSLTSLSNAATKPRLGDIPVEKETTLPKKETPKKDSQEMTIEEHNQIKNDVAEDFYKKGLLAVEAGRYEEAEGYFDRVLILKPRHQGAKEGIEFVLKKLEQARVKEESVDKEQALIKALEEKLKKQISENQNNKALDVAHELLAIDPANDTAKKSIPLIHEALFTKAVERSNERAEREDFQGAIDALEVALKYKKDSNVQEKIEQYQGRLGEQQHKKSEEIYLKALEESQSGNPEEALRLCKKALSLNPENLQAQKMLERLEPVYNKSK